MRKVLILILLLFFCSLCILFNHSNNSLVVFNEVSNNYNVYELDISKSNVTTKNLKQYFSSYTIISIRPDINPIYKSLININTYDFDNNKSLEYNIDKFSEIYIQQLDNNSLDSEIINYNYVGLKINALTLYITKNQLNFLLSNNKFSLN